MKKHLIRPLEIVSDQIMKLQERLEGTADPREKSVLVKRLDNLKKVLEFLASNQCQPITASPTHYGGTMKRLSLICLVISLLSPLAAFGSGLEGFLANVNVQAQADLPGFSARLSTQFGVPAPKVQAVIQSVPQPADAFMILQLGQMSGKQPETVLAVYSPNKKKGWGAIAKELGIKPGSAEFHALKNGDLSFTGQPVSSYETRGKGKGRGHNK